MSPGPPESVVEVDGELIRLLPAFLALRQIIWLLRADGSVERFNPYWTEYTGLPSVIDGLGWADVFHPEDRQRLINTRSIGVAGRKSYEVEARMRRGDGVYRRHLCRVVPLWHGDELAGWVGTAIDVEDVRAAEDAARTSEWRKQKVLESISDGYYRLDRAWRFVEVNSAFERMTGRKRREVIGENLWVVFPDAPAVDDYMRVALGNARREERWSGAARRWVEITTYRSPDGFECYFRDITDRRRHEVWQRSLMRIAEELRRRDDDVDGATLAAQVIGEALGLVRAGYVHVSAADPDEVWIERDWVSSAGQRRSAGRYRISDWGSYLLPLTIGETVAIEDVETDPRTSAAADGWRTWNVRGAAFIPLVTRGRLDGYLMLHDDRPRPWTEDELAFVRTVSDLVWASLSRREANAPA